MTRLLFEPEEGDSRRFRSGLVAREPEGFPGEHYPLVLVDDLPFLVPKWLGGRSGFDRPVESVVRDARQHGRLRAAPLRPGDDPLALYDRLVALTALPPRNYPELSIWIATAEAIGIPYERRYGVVRSARGLREMTSFLRPPRADEWNRVRTAIESCELRWDATRQAYERR